MKLLLITSLLSLSLPSLAEGEDFAKIKAMMLSNIDSRLSNLQASRKCVADAKDEAQMKSCREEMKKSHEKMKQERKAKRDTLRALKKK